MDHGNLRLEDLLRKRGLKMTGPRRTISRVLLESPDHPDVEELHRRAAAIDRSISLATVYRTVRLLEEAQIIRRLDFGDGRARYEGQREEHHHHLIDLTSGAVIEFSNDDIEKLMVAIARKHGYTLVGHRLELYGQKATNARSAKPRIDAGVRKR